MEQSRIVDIAPNEINPRRGYQNISKAQQTARDIDQSDSLTISRTGIKRFTYIFGNILANVRPAQLDMKPPETVTFRNRAELPYINVPIKNDVDMPTMTPGMLFVDANVSVTANQITHITARPQRTPASSNHAQRQIMLRNGKRQKPQTPTPSSHFLATPSDTQTLFHAIPFKRVHGLDLVHNVLTITRLDHPASRAALAAGRGVAQLLIKAHYSIVLSV